MNLDKLTHISSAYFAATYMKWKYVLFDNLFAKISRMKGYISLFQLSKVPDKKLLKVHLSQTNEEKSVWLVATTTKVIWSQFSSNVDWILAHL